MIIGQREWKFGITFLNESIDLVCHDVVTWYLNKSIYVIKLANTHRYVQ